MAAIIDAAQRLGYRGVVRGRWLIMAGLPVVDFQP
jgi:hypothetical protein